MHLIHYIVHFYRKLMEFYSSDYLEPEDQKDLMCAGLI